MAGIRIMVISDVHSNRQALEAVLACAIKLRVKYLVSLGDVLGYGADPVPCLDLLINYKTIFVQGNHEQAALGEEMLIDKMSSLAQAGLKFCCSVLPAPYKKRLIKWPFQLKINPLDIRLGHASFVETWRYVRTTEAVAQEIAQMQTSIGFLGHTHQPFVFCNGQYYKGAELLNQVFEFKVGEHNKFLANPGSVGQPRDQDTRASFGILDLDGESQRARFKIFRVNYDIQAAALKIIQAGLPEFFATRLFCGI